MINVSVVNNLTSATFGGNFPDSGTANTWVAQGEAGNWWGRPARQVSSEDPKITNENISLATSSQQETDSNGNPYTLYTFSADYTVTQTDITTQYNQQLAIQQALVNQSVGAMIIANVAALNEQLLNANTMTPTQFAALLADQTILNIERLLWNGSLVTAKALINANLTDLQQYYTTDQINQILALFPS